MSVITHSTVSFHTVDQTWIKSLLSFLCLLTFALSPSSSSLFDPCFSFIPSLPQYSSVEALSWSTAVKTRLTSCWQRAESGAEAKKTVEMDLSMPLVISLNIIKSFYSFRSSRGPGWDDERCREGFILPLISLPLSLCQESCCSCCPCCPVCCCCQTRSLNSF